MEAFGTGHVPFSNERQSARRQSNRVAARLCGEPASASTLCWAASCLERLTHTIAQARDNEHGQGTRNHGRAKHDLNSHSENAASTEKTQAGLVYQVDGSAQFLLATGTPSRQPLAVLNGVTPGVRERALACGDS